MKCTLFSLVSSSPKSGHGIDLNLGHLWNTESDHMALRKRKTVA